jgi:Holliday junction DNA helicase RuvA
MIGRLTGKVVSSEGDSAVVVDVGGVGYEVSVPIGTVGRARADEAGKVTLFVHTHVREDQITLFGFATPDDRHTFRTLIGVSNVGPKTAIAVLGALPAGDLARAVATKDVARLQTIGGVGKKTAERLVLELRDKLPIFSGSGNATADREARAVTGSEDLLRSALANMSFRPPEIDRAVAVLGDRIATGELPQLIREALGVLAK